MGKELADYGEGGAVEWRSPGTGKSSGEGRLRADRLDSLAAHMGKLEVKLRQHVEQLEHRSTNHEDCIANINTRLSSMYKDMSRFCDKTNDALDKVAKKAGLTAEPERVNDLEKAVRRLQVSAMNLYRLISEDRRVIDCMRGLRQWLDADIGKTHANWAAVEQDEMGECDMRETHV